MITLVINGYQNYLEINGIRETSGLQAQTPASVNSALASSASGTPTIPVFANCMGYNSYDQYTDTRVYRFRIYDYELGRYRVDLIPCYRESDEQPGFYDIVNNVFRYDEQNASVGVYATIGDRYF